MKLLHALATLVMLSPLALAIPIHGDGCGGDGPGLGIIDTGFGFYVDERSANGVWVWEESNGIAGPQWLNTDWAFVPGDHYGCGYDDPLATPDTLIA